MEENMNANQQQNWQPNNGQPNNGQPNNGQPNYYQQNVYNYGNQEEISDKSKVVAAVLAFFLGTLGIHRFYLGKIGSGIAMLVLWIISAVLSLVLVGAFGFVILGIWALVDFILILVGSLKDSKGRKLS